MPPEALRGVLRWLLAILHSGDPLSEAALVQAALADDTLEFTARAAILEGLREQDAPNSETVPVMAQHLDHEGYLKIFFDGLHAVWRSTPPPESQPQAGCPDRRGGSAAAQAPLRSERGSTCCRRIGSTS